MIMSDHRIRPIHSEQDYADALARVEALIDMERSDVEDDELDVLATLVEVYEDRHFPMDSPDPIEAIKFRMKSSGLTAGLKKPPPPVNWCPPARPSHD
jgi:HTH-type transcriptional regulator / antitoxin HigA